MDDMKQALEAKKWVFFVVVVVVERQIGEKQIGGEVSG